jgi:hypothetical protein
MTRACFVSATLVVCVAELCGHRGLAQTIDPRPPSVVWDEMLTPVLEQMLGASATFRQQWYRIVNKPQLKVHLRLSILPQGTAATAARARCVLSRYEFGGMRAEIELRTIDDLAELLAHELEHVLEWTEGINYALLAVAEPASVWMVGNHNFETRRAMDAGARVAREIAISRTTSKLR